MPSESKWFKMVAKLIIWSILAALGPKLYKMMQNKPFGRLQPTPPRGMCPSTNPSEGYVLPRRDPLVRVPSTNPSVTEGPGKNKIRHYGRGHPSPTGVGMCARFGMPT